MNNCFIIFGLILIVFSVDAKIHLVLTSGEVEVDKEYFVQPKIEIKTHENGDPTLNMDGTALQEIADPNVRVDLKIDSPTGFQDFITTPSISLCSFFAEPEKIPILNMMLEDMKKFGNFSTSCPIPKGSYYLHDFKIDSDKIPPMAPDGKYRVDLEFLVDTKVIFKAMWHATINHV